MDILFGRIHGDSDFIFKFFFGISILQEGNDVGISLIPRR